MIETLLSAFGVRVEKAELSQEPGLRLKDKVAIVTGGDSGIGRAVSIAMAAEGASLVVDYHGEESEAAKVVRQIENSRGAACAIAGDVTKPQEVQQLVDAAVSRYGKLDIMVNNAAFEEQRPFLEMPLDVYERVIAVTLTGVWLCTQSAARAMVERGLGGRIINISSIHEEVTMPTNAPYCAAKAGVRMLTRTLAVELAQYGITVNNVCPGAIATPINENVRKDPKKCEALLSEIPMRRVGKPEEVAAMCVYLASDAASYVTGASLFIDGGMSKQSGSL